MTMRLFSIDRVTGQIMTKGKLNAEAVAEGDRDTTVDGFQLQVTVTATDPWNTCQQAPGTLPPLT